MPKRVIFKRSCRELSLDVPTGVYILLIVEQSSLESLSRVCAKTLILTVCPKGLRTTDQQPNNETSIRSAEKMA